jgi:ribosome-binding factor A
MLVREVSDIIHNKLKDPRMGFVSVTKVELSPDCTSAKISVSVLGGDGEKSKTMHALQHARGFVQREAGHAVRLRTMPRITFQLDESIEKSIEICRIIDRAVEKDREAGIEPDNNDNNEE